MTATPRPTRRQNRRLRYIVLGVLAFAVVLLLLSLFLWARHRAFLSSSSYAFVKDYLASASEDTFLSPTEEYLAEHLSPYEDEIAVREHLAEQIDPKKMTFARAEGYTDKHPVYTIYIRGEAAFTLCLKSRFSLTGQPSWQVDSLTVDENNDISHPLVLEVPHGALVTVGGVELSSAAATSSPYFALTQFEQSMKDEIYADRYELGRFFLTPELTVLYDGARLQAATVEGDTLRYAYPSTSTQVTTITVPYGASVAVNGKPLTNNHRIDAGGGYPFLTRFEKDLPGLTTVTVYQISGLFAEPTVTVRYNGILLAPEEGSYTYRLPEDQMKTVVITAPSYATVKLNGIPLTDGEISKKKVELPLFEGVVGYAKDRPYGVEYTVSGLLLDPIITAYDKNGSALTVSTYDTKDNHTVINCTPGTAVPDRELLTLRTFAELLTTYLYSGSSGQSRNFDNVTAMTPGDSPAFRSLKEIYASLYTADPHKNIIFGEMKIRAYYPYSQTTYSATLTLPFTSEYNGVSYTNEVTVDVLYIYSGNIRRIINYRILNASFVPSSGS